MTKVMDFLFDTMGDDIRDNLGCGSYSELDGNGDLVIHTDQGNESCYGFDRWDFRIDGYAILSETYGRDTFEENLSDAIVGEFIGDSGIVDIETFEKHLKLHIEKWTAESAEYRKKYM